VSFKRYGYEFIRYASQYEECVAFLQHYPELQVFGRLICRYPSNVDEAMVESSSMRGRHALACKVTRQHIELVNVCQAAAFVKNWFQLSMVSTWFKVAPTVRLMLMPWVMLSHRPSACWNVPLVPFFFQISTELVLLSEISTP
jgi:hypothetical protein